MVGITAVRAVSNMQSVGFRKPVVLFLRYMNSGLGFVGFPLFSFYVGVPKINRKFE
jgi:hypothetical protein